MMSKALSVKKIGAVELLTQLFHRLVQVSALNRGAAFNLPSARTYPANGSGLLLGLRNHLTRESDSSCVC
jgi:hypothetical protein